MEREKGQTSSEMIPQLTLPTEMETATAVAVPELALDTELGKEELENEKK